MQLFYHPEIDPALPLQLPEEESAHCIRVLRMKAGDTIILTDGKGMFYEGAIMAAHAKKCILSITRSFPDPAKRNFRLTIAIAPTKSIDRFEWFLEKATEIGCDEIIPIQCKHSERTSVKTERLNKVVVSAMKQCLKSQLPVLQELCGFNDFISSHVRHAFPDGAGRYICHIPELDAAAFPPKNPAGKHLSSCLQSTSGTHTIITIGPEGGFSEDEVAFALKNKFTPVSLGNSRLRVETAGVVACAIVNSISG